MTKREWCIVPRCDEEVIVVQRVELPTSDTKERIEVEVPFCRGHGPQAGGDV